MRQMITKTALPNDHSHQTATKRDVVAKTRVTKRDLAAKTSMAHDSKDGTDAAERDESGVRIGLRLEKMGLDVEACGRWLAYREAGSQ